jgi:CBS-domain-containing membrane protein
MRKTVGGKRVRDVMSRNPLTVSPDATIQELMTKFKTHDFNMFPVVDARGILRGIVTKLDLLRAFRPQMRRFIPDLKLLWAERIEDLMSRGAISVEGDDPITVAVDTMIEARLRSLPVVERRPGGPVVVGVVSRSDVLPYLTLESDEPP